MFVSSWDPLEVGGIYTDALEVGYDMHEGVRFMVLRQVSKEQWMAEEVKQITALISLTHPGGACDAS